MRLDLSEAICVTSTGRSGPLTAGSPGLGQAVEPVRRHPWPALPPAQHASTPLPAPGAAATAARARAGLLAASRPGPSAPRPALASTAARAGPSPGPASARAPVTAGVNGPGANRRSHSPHTIPAAAARRPRAAYAPLVPPSPAPPAYRLEPLGLEPRWPGHPAGWG